MFQKAVKFDARGRVALIGPAGSGKSFTMLTLAQILAGPQGRIAAVDTEHGSLSKYADLFNFEVCELDSFAPDQFLKALAAAEKAKFSVFCCDSLSHFWTGKDGALEFVDLAAKKHRDNMGGWKEFRPHERAMVDAMIASPLHIVVTMRTKTEYVEEVNPSTGKKQRRKVGLAPVQREGLEYEFDLVGYMDDENNLIVDKTRCPEYSGKVVPKPGVKAFQPFCDWLKGAERKSLPPDSEKGPSGRQGGGSGRNTSNGTAPSKDSAFRATDNDVPANMGGTWVDDKAGGSAGDRVEAAREHVSEPVIAEPEWKTMGDVRASYETMGKILGGDLCARIMTSHKFDFKENFGKEKAVTCYREMAKMAARAAAQQGVQ